MSLIEQGQVDLRLSTVYRIARGLDLSVSELLDLETQAGVSTETASETGQ